ncbi:MAG: hypothetical protein ACUVRA_07500 [Candidatus Bathyarchaeaceae archaeon]
MKSKLKIENPVVLLFSIFYAIVGIAFLFVFVIYNLRFLHLGIIGVLSLIAAYGVFRMEKWAVWLVIALFFLGTTAGAIILANSIVNQTFGGALLFHVALIAYLIITIVASIYVAAKRKNFE